MKKKIEHTPTPWRRGRGAGYLTVGPLIVANDNQEANAAFVERAVNTHDALMAAASRFLDAVRKSSISSETGWVWTCERELTAALAKAEGK